MLIRRKSSTDDEYHHEDPLGVFGVITGANGAVLSSSVYDMFSVQQFRQGTVNTAWRFNGSRIMQDGITGADDGQSYYFPERSLSHLKQPDPTPVSSCVTISGSSCGIASSAPWYCKSSSMPVPKVTIDTCTSNCPNKRNCKTVHLSGGVDGAITVIVTHTFGVGPFKKTVHLSVTCPVHCKNGTQTTCECGPARKKKAASVQI